MKRKLYLNKKMCKNIFYMLCYAVDELAYFRLDESRLDNIRGIDDLLATILVNALDIWSDDSILRDYKDINICTDRIAGRIDFVKSYQTGSIANGMLHCGLSRLNEDTEYNQIIKFAIQTILYNGDDVKTETHVKLLNYFNNFLHVTNIDYSQYRLFDINTSELPTSYRPVIAASRIVIDNMLISDEIINEPNERPEMLFQLDDSERYSRIFEKFVRNFYKKEYDATVSTPAYQMEGIDDNGNICVSGWDKPDIVLTKGNRTLIVDTKWYLNSHNESANRHEIESYIDSFYRFTPNSKEYNVSGIILYANNGSTKSKDYIKPKTENISRKVIIYQRTIDMNCDFDNIKRQLIDLIDNLFNV